MLVAGIVGCGGSGLEDYELSSFRADAAGAAADIGLSCLDGSGSASEFSESVDTLLDAYSGSMKDAEVKQTLRGAAGTLRDCGQDEQAERVDRATD
jgi:hypothetical protein